MPKKVLELYDAQRQIIKALGLNIEDNYTSINITANLNNITVTTTRNIVNPENIEQLTEVLGHMKFINEEDKPLCTIENTKLPDGVNIIHIATLKDLITFTRKRIIENDDDVYMDRVLNSPQHCILYIEYDCPDYCIIQQTLVEDF